MHNLANVMRRYGFKKSDAEKFDKAQKFEIPCDWCGQPFSNEWEPSVDHDHHCSCKNRLSKNAKNSCTLCLRGFVHQPCNREIGVLEWRETIFHVTDARLAKYREKFPVPRNVPLKRNKRVSTLLRAWVNGNKGTGA